MLIAVCTLVHGAETALEGEGRLNRIAEAPEEAAPTRRVALVRLRLPIAGSDDAVHQSRIQRAVDSLLAGESADRRPLLVLEFSAPTDGGTTEFERALRLARFLVSDEMARVKTIAYLPDSVEGHAVLVALACEEVAMAPEAQLGRAGADEDTTRPLEPGIRASYQQIAEARRTAPAPVVLAMADRDAELVRVESDQGVEFALSDSLDTLREERSIVSEEVLAPAGTLAVFSGREARAEGLAKYLVSDRDALARALGVPAADLVEDQSIAGEWRPIMVDLSGPVTMKSVRRLETLIGDEIDRSGANWIGVRIDSSGGDLQSALRLAQSLAELGDGEARSVAYVPKRAEGAAALVALACDQLVMQQGAILAGDSPPAGRPKGANPVLDEGVEDNEAEAGNKGGEAEPADDRADEADEERRLQAPAPGDDGARQQVDAALVTVRGALAPETSRTWSALAATFDSAIELGRYANRETGADRLFSEEELQEQDDPAAWRRLEEVKAADEALELTAERAVEVGLAWQTVEQFDDLQALYGLTAPPRTAEPNWALELVEALASPGLAALLLIVGLIGMYIELNSPGLGIGGFVATVALLLFFWSKFLDGTADWLEVLLFVSGLVFVLLELLVIPGFGVFGLGGALLMIASLVLASQTFILPKTESQLFELRNSLATVAGAGLGCLVLAAVLRQYLPHSPLFRRMTLAPLEEADRIDQERRESMADYERLVGLPGTATTNLLPAGRAEIAGEPVDVVSRGEMIERGDPIEVVEVRGSRVVVRRVNA